MRPQMMERMRRFCADRRGAALMEVAFSLPVLMILLTGTVETGILLMLNQKLQHSAVAISDLTTRDEEISEATMTDIFNAAPQIMAPFDMDDRARIVVSAAGNDASGNPTIYWQRTGAGSLAQASLIGAEGGAPALPADIPIRDNETIIITEVFFEYQPIFFPVIDPVLLRRTAYFRPRIGALTQID